MSDPLATDPGSEAARKIGCICDPQPHLEIPTAAAGKWEARAFWTACASVGNALVAAFAVSWLVAWPFIIVAWICMSFALVVQHLRFRRYRDHMRDMPKLRAFVVEPACPVHGIAELAALMDDR